MKDFKGLQVSIDFSTSFFISLASGGRPLIPYKCIFPKFPLNFRVNFHKFEILFQKPAKFPLKFQKNYNVFIDFLKFFENVLVWKTQNFWFLKCKISPPIAPGTHSSSWKSCINYWYSINEILWYVIDKGSIYLCLILINIQHSEGIIMRKFDRIPKDDENLTNLEISFKFRMKNRFLEWNLE